MDYQSRVRALRSEYEGIVLQISQPVARMHFLEGQIDVLNELWKEEQDAKAAREKPPETPALPAPVAPQPVEPDPVELEPVEPDPVG